MTDTPALSPLIRRLAIERVAAPGLLNRHGLQRAPQKFLHRSGAAMVGRLFRRIESAVPSASNLPFVSIDRSADAYAPSSSTHADADATAQPPVVEHAGELVARQIAAPLIDSSRAVYKSAGHLPVVAGSSTAHEFQAPSPFVNVTAAGSDPPGLMRKAEPGPVPAAARASSPDAESRVINLQAAQATSNDVRATLPAIIRRSVALTLQRHVAEPIVRVAESRPQSAFAPIAMALTSAPPAAHATSTSVPLLLRKAETAMPSRSTEQQPSRISASAPNVIAREVAAPQSTSDAKAHARAMECFGDPEIDRIAEQVASRLARRLEVERERLGVRPWRQGN